MELSERKQRILRAIVEQYILTAEPIGSKTISQMPGMDFSPATIRNEMAELTTLGYLEQPHTSAGRIPSAAGYRLYVDELMQDYRLSVDETRSINQAMELKMQEFDKAITQVGRLVSQMTNLPAYAVAAHRTDRTIKRFDLILAEQGSFILVVMTSDNAVRNKLIRLPVSVEESDLKLLGAVLNAIDLKKFKVFSMICYLVMGWLIVFSVKAAIEAATMTGFLWLLSGGVAFTVGAVLYIIGKKKRYIHSVFHVFVVIGTLLQAVCVLFYVL